MRVGAIGVTTGRHASMRAEQKQSSSSPALSHSSNGLTAEREAEKDYVTELPVHRLRLVNTLWAKLKDFCNSVIHGFEE